MADILAKSKKVRTYEDLKSLTSFEERFEYLKLSGEVGASTFGFDRYLNQVFYTSKEWKSVRRHVIIRDEACDLGIADRPINDYIIVHHMNPIAIEDILARADWILDPKYLICVSRMTHEAIHYGDKNLLVPSTVTERKPGDTTPWRRQ